MIYQTLIHLGCGIKPDIENYLQLAEQCWLIDADSEVISQLQEAYSDICNLHFQQEIITVYEQEATFYHYNLPWANGLKPVDDKTQQLYPGLQCIKTTKLQTQPINDLITDILKTEGHHLLILSLGLQNEEILHALDKSGILTELTTVILDFDKSNSSQIKIPHSFYIASNASQLIQLRENSVLLERHPLVKDLENTKEELSVTKQLCNQQMEQIEAQMQQLTELTEEKNQQESKLADLSQQLEVLTKQTEDLSKERESLKQQLGVRADQTNQQESKLADLSQQLEVLTKQTEDLSKERESLKQQLTERTEQTNHQESKLAELSQLNEEKTKLIEVIKKEKDEALHQNHINFEAKNNTEAELQKITAQRDELIQTADSLTQEKATFLQQQDQLISQTQEERKHWLAKFQTQEHLEQNLVRVEAQLDLLKQLLIQNRSRKYESRNTKK